MRLFLRAFAVLATTFAVAGNVRADEALSDLVSRHADVEALAELERLPVTPERRYLRGRLLERRGELVGAAEAYARPRYG